LPQSGFEPMKFRRKVVVLGSVADHGTRSITEAFERSLQPALAMRLEFGLKRMGPRRIWDAVRFLFANRGPDVSMICLHRAPILLAGLLPFARNARWVGVIDSNETFPFELKGLPAMGYDSVYRHAFRRLDAIYSPWAAFSNYYRNQGVSVGDCSYPLPFPEATVSAELPGTIRLLFIGADYVRKGGDLLLNGWQRAAPPGAKLTFVSPNGPRVSIPGVTFLRDIVSGSREHRMLFENHDLLILPSRVEPYGFVLLEAVNHGLGVVTTQNAGAADMVRSFGGIITDSPEKAVDEAIRLASSALATTELKSRCRASLPAYRAQVDRSMRRMVYGDDGDPDVGENG